MKSYYRDTKPKNIVDKFLDIFRQDKEAFYKRKSDQNLVNNRMANILGQSCEIARKNKKDMYYERWVDVLSENLIEAYSRLDPDEISKIDFDEFCNKIFSRFSIMSIENSIKQDDKNYIKT